MTLEFAGNMLCSAGVSYFHVYPNGDVYRCLADYNARRPPMFNLKRDGWKGAVDPTVCDHERCYNACDLDWTTKWQVDEQGRAGEDLRRPAQGHGEGRLAAPVLAAPGVAAAPDGLLHLVADAGVQLHLRLLRLRGRREAHQDDFPSSYPELTVDEWIDIWSDILERFDYGILSITGGEPLLSEATIPVLGMVTQKFACYITSNISRNIMEFTRGRIRPGARRVRWKASARCPSASPGSTAACTPPPRASTGSSSRARSCCCGTRASRSRSTTWAIRCSSIWRPNTRRGANRTRSSSPCRPGRAWTTTATSRATPFPERTFFEEIAPSHRKKANELVFMDCRYDVTLDNPMTRVLMADVLTLTGRIRNLSRTAWQIGSGPGRWSVAGYLTRVGRHKQWVRELRTSPPDCGCRRTANWSSPSPIDTRGLPAGIYEVWIDMLMDGRNWMALHGAVPATAILRIETFSHEIAVDADAVTAVARRLGRLERHLAQHLRQAVARGRRR